MSLVQLCPLHQPWPNNLVSLHALHVLRDQTLKINFSTMETNIFHTQEGG